MWNGVCYRVMGSQFCRVEEDGTVVSIGDVGTGGQCVFDYSFDRLAITSGGRLYYYNGTTLSRVTDANLGTALDVVWVDGYFMTTDGEYLVVTELNDPTVVNPLKYGSSEIDPDPVNSVMKLRNEIYAVNRNTIEVFRNVGGQFFPFQRIEGAQVQKGSVGTFASCVFNESIAFVGSGRNEAIGIFLAAKAQCQRISTSEIETLLAGYTSAELTTVVLEPRSSAGRNHLWVRLPDRTLVFDHEASQMAGVPVWFVLTSGTSGFSRYLGADLVHCYGQWLVADPVGTELGYLSDNVSTQWGEDARWEFGTSMVYNESRGAIFHSLELVCLTGRIALGSTPTISTSYSVDGETWSQKRFVSMGGQGERTKRLVWFGCGHMRHWRIQRFEGTSSAFLTIARLEAALEPLNV